MARPEAPSIPPGTVLAGKYVLGAKLGAGGMGAVYEATDPSGRVVAVKTLLVGPGAPAAAAETRARFLREIETTARLAPHKHVVSLLDQGVDDASGAPYLVMPRLRGEDLGQVLGRAKVLEPSVAIPIVVQACRGVAVGHAAGIIHRDIKPTNLFLEEENGIVLVKVTDFGLAKVQAAGIDSLTSSGALLGTPHYMSPEQAENAKRVDPRTDVFALGMVLYHALTGAVAFARPGSFMAFLVGQATVPPLQDKAPWVSPAVARVVHAALLRAPDARWPDLGEMDLALTMAAGYEIANAPLYRASFAGVSQATRAQVAPRATLPAHWEELLRG
ncbi:MAG: serine/threonine protein kinase [Labilithrix sp.]|nr:serine/threonine protein kinase [Labilithrix sp.]MCW5810647.1 serine/threonine protein kinase [Labilithrix sp.]